MKTDCLEAVILEISQILVFFVGFWKQFVVLKDFKLSEKKKSGFSF